MSNNQHNPSWYNPGWTGPMPGYPQQWGVPVQGQQQQGYSQAVQQGWGVPGSNCYNNVFQGCMSEQSLRNTVQPAQYGQGQAQQGQAQQGQAPQGQAQQGQAQQGQAQQENGGGSGQQAAGGPYANATAPPLNPSFQTRCTPPDPAVHQLLETWVGNMQKELERQSEINRNMLTAKVKEMCMFLGSQGVIRPSC